MSRLGQENCSAFRRVRTTSKEARYETGHIEESAGTLERELGEMREGVGKLQL
jgi:hypothetical protein